MLLSLDARALLIRMSIIKSWYNYCKNVKTLVNLYKMTLSAVPRMQNYYNRFTLKTEEKELEVSSFFARHPFSHSVRMYALLLVISKYT